MTQPSDAGSHGRRRDVGRPADGRGHEPGEHPTVARSGRSRGTAIGLVVALAAAALLYVAITAGMSLPGL